MPKGLTCAKSQMTSARRFTAIRPPPLNAITVSLHKAFDDTDLLVCYSIKANSNQAVIKTLADLGAGMDIVSEGELRRARAAGVPGERIVFSGVGKAAREMAAALDEDILCFNVESKAELELLNEVAGSKGKVAPVSLRINPDVDAKTHRKISTGKAEDKFGISWINAEAAYARAAELPHISIRGIDMHIGSQITDLEPFEQAFTLLAELVVRLRAAGHTIEHVDLGGGLGIPYRGTNDVPPHPDEYAALVKRTVGPLGCKLHVRTRPDDRRQCRHLWSPGCCTPSLVKPSPSPLSTPP